MLFTYYYSLKTSDIYLENHQRFINYQKKAPLENYVPVCSFINKVKVTHNFSKCWYTNYIKIF